MKITKGQRLQLIGLRTVALDLNDRLDDTIRAAGKITGEEDPFGHTADMMSDYRTVDDGLGLLDIEVSDD